MVIGAGPSFGPPQRMAMSMAAGADAKRCAFVRSGPQADCVSSQSYRNNALPPSVRVK